MKKFLVFTLLILQTASLSWAQSSQDKRRVEEEKRTDLSPSEFYLPTAEKPPLPDNQSAKQAYFSELLAKKAARLKDAYKVLVILMGVEEQYPGIDAQFDFLKEQGVIPKKILREADLNTLLRKGAAAYMFARAMDIKGGIILRIFGLSERYAFKELVYQEIMYPGNVHDILSGPELILTLTHAADYIAAHQKDLTGDPKE